MNARHVLSPVCFLVFAGLCLAQETKHESTPSLAGTHVWDVAIAPVLSQPAPQDVLWGKGLPEKILTATDVPRLLNLIASKEYIVGIIGAPTGPAWLEVPQNCRAVILPDQAIITETDAHRLTAYAREGGIIFAFGHASLLEPSGTLRTEYRLSDLFGARYAGRVAFEMEKNPVTFSSDSIFSKQYGPENVADGTDNFWASKDAPMPHWVQMDFPVPKQISRVDVVNRHGFMLKDFDVQFRRGQEWVTITAVRNNENQRVTCLFEQPIEIKSLRLLVLKEMVGDKDRQIADVGEIEPYDSAGRKIFAPPYLIEACIREDSWIKHYRSPRLRVRSPVLRIQPISAKPIATFADPAGHADLPGRVGDGAELPLCVVNSVGKGRAYLFAIPEAVFFAEPQLFDALLRAFVGMPFVRHSGDEKIALALARTETGYLLRVTDTDAERAARAKDRRIHIKLNIAMLGPIPSATLVSTGTPLSLTIRNEWAQFSLPLAESAVVRLTK